jgi:hypothetical protein
MRALWIGITCVVLSGARGRAGAAPDNHDRATAAGLIQATVDVAGENLARDGEPPRGRRPQTADQRRDDDLRFARSAARSG